MLTTNQQELVTEAVEFTEEHIGGAETETNKYQRYVDAMDDLCNGAMTEAQFDEFSMQLFLVEIKHLTPSEFLATELVNHILNQADTISGLLALLHLTQFETLPRGVDLYKALITSGRPICHIDV